MQAAIRNFLVKITEFIFASAPISFPQKLNRIMDLLHIFEITVCEKMDDPELWSRVNNSWCCDTGMDWIGQQLWGPALISMWNQSRYHHQLIRHGLDWSHDRSVHFTFQLKQHVMWERVSWWWILEEEATIWFHAVFNGIAGWSGLLHCLLKS